MNLEYEFETRTKWNYKAADVTEIKERFLTITLTEYDPDGYDRTFICRIPLQELKEELDALAG